MRWRVWFDRLIVLLVLITVFDVIGLGIAGGMIAMLAGRAARNLRELAKAEPAASRRASRP